MNSVADQWPKSHRLTVDEYYRMAEAGLLAHDARVELIEGEVIDMAPIGSRHAGIVNRLNRLLDRAVGDRAVVAVQQPLRLDSRSEPQPDLCVLKPRPDFYGNSHPAPGDVLLLIEVSDATLAYDQGPKAALYARHGIPELWVVDAQGGQLICMRQPSAAGYSWSAVLGIQASVEVAALPDIRIELAAFLD